MNSVKKYFGLSLDPVHIGAGGYRLGRVDNTIVRDPATNIPKIPGTSLAGVIREYSTIYLQEKNGGKKDRESAETEIKKYFGNQKRQGALRFYDSQIIFFPVSSNEGTVWVTTKEIVSFWMTINKEKLLKVNIDLPDEEVFPLKGIKGEQINLGWVLFGVTDTDNKIKPPNIFQDKIKRIAIVSDNVFSQLINDNLEVRTSVRIDYQTGAAEKGGLFTYEAIPRGTVFGFEMIIDKRRQEEDGELNDILEHALSYIEVLGLGGMGTRGFGRVSFLKMGEGKKDNG